VFADEGKLVDTIDFGLSEYCKKSSPKSAVVRNSYVGDFNTFKFEEKYDLVWCSHILEHQLNPNLFLRKIRDTVREGGIVALIVPPRKPIITDGHVSLWNAGLVLYHLVLAGFDCSEHLWITQYDYNIGVVFRSKHIPDSIWPKDLCMDTGDLKKLSRFFPKELGFGKGSNGDIFDFPNQEIHNKVAVLIPARYNSSRFPGKALHHLDGIPMIRRVFDACSRSGLDVYVLSDDESILSEVPQAIMTSSSCKNGTERCAEAAAQLKSYNSFINVQGDMPDITPDIILAVAKYLACNQLVSLYTPFAEKQHHDPNCAKLVRSSSSSAVWCTRSPISYGVHQLGIYGYSKSVLAKYPYLPVCEAELLEDLEQIRWFNSGFEMKVYEVQFSGTEINCPEDSIQWHEKQVEAPASAGN
jgi:CMP-2-keto-3-deoxyoctulosonic acid synthetase